MDYKFYKIDISLYDNLQLNINNAFYDKYIAIHKFDFILNNTPQLVNNGFVYVVLPSLIYNDPLILNYIDQLIEISESEYFEIANQL